MKTKHFFYALSAFIFVVVVVFAFIYSADFSLPWQQKIVSYSDFSDRLDLAKLKSGKFVLIDENEKIVSPRIDHFLIQPGETDSLIPYVEGGFRGYFNQFTLVDQIPSKNYRYLKAWIFDNQSGLAAVLDADTRKIGFIDKTGTYQIKPTIHYKKNYNYVFLNGECVVPDSTGYYFIINPQGQKTIDMPFSEVGSITNGLRVVAKLDSFGIVKDSILYLPISYDAITFQENNLIVLRQGEKQWSVDFNLRTVTPFVFDDFNNLEIHFNNVFPKNVFEDSEDYESEANEENSAMSITHSEFFLVDINLKTGLFDFKNQRFVIPPIYDHIYAVGQNEKSFSLWGFKGGFWFPIKLE